MHGKPLRLPGLARGGKHGGLARPGQTDDGGDALAPGDMPHRLALLLRQKRPRRQSRFDAPLLDAKTGSRRHPVGALRHAAFDGNHFARRIARALRDPPKGILLLGLQFDQGRRRHHLRKRRLERLRRRRYSDAASAPRRAGRTRSFRRSGSKAPAPAFRGSARRCAARSPDQAAAAKPPCRAAPSAWRERPYAASARSQARARRASGCQFSGPVRRGQDAHWRLAPRPAGFRQAEPASKAGPAPPAICSRAPDTSCRQARPASRARVVIIRCA